MIECPSCKQQLPEWAQTCQFCKADVSKIARPKSSPKMGASGVPQSIWIAYYGIASYFVLTGLIRIVITLVQAKGDLGSYGAVGLISAGISIIIGAGLIAKINFIRGIVNFCSALNALGAALGIFGSSLGGLFVGLYALLFVFLNVIDLATNVGMIYLIGETDRGMR
ncbi:MAG: hypothetical protein ACOYON_03045 [Fimbriimonas sp.]